MMRDAFLALVFAVLVELLSDGCTRLSLWMVKRAASQLPRRYRQRWHEEWCADLESRSRLLRPIFVLGLFHAAFILRREYVRMALARRGSVPKALASDHASDVIKRAVDVVGALTIALLFAPVIFVVITIMSMESGPIFTRHRRLGRGGRTFECLKFRTMVPNSEHIVCDLLGRSPVAQAEWLRDHKLRHDPRITRVGRFLRTTSLDELPQLWNVLRGEMSLVGPLPIVREDAARYGRHLSAYLATRPGLTGLWQLTGKNDTDYRRRAVLDAYYARKQSVLVDLQILLKTVKAVLWRRDV